MIKQIVGEIDLFLWFIRQGFKECHWSFIYWQWLMSDWEEERSVRFQANLFWTDLSQYNPIHFSLSDRIFSNKGAIE